MMNDTTISPKQFLELLITRTTHVAVAGRMSIKIEEEELPDLIDKHLQGKQRLGFYNLLSDSTVRWSVIDLDTHGRTVQEIDYNKRFIRQFHRLSSQFNMDGYYERSKTNGIHIWHLYKEPKPASEIRPLITGLVQLVGELAKLPEDYISSIEIFPKQIKLNEGELGNMVWLPYFGGTDHLGGGVPTGHTVFYEYDD